MQLPWRLFGGIIVLWLLVGVIPFLFWGDLHEAAEFASAFGFVNALFAALAFGGVIWAIRLQTKELELQRLELEETRDELRRSADAQTLSQQMHFLSALLAARNNVVQGYAVAADRESGPLRPNQTAHRQHLAEPEWLLAEVDRHQGNPFRLPPDTCWWRTRWACFCAARTCRCKRRLATGPRTMPVTCLSSWARPCANCAACWLARTQALCHLRSTSLLRRRQPP